MGLMEVSPWIGSVLMNWESSTSCFSCCCCACTRCCPARRSSSLASHCIPDHCVVAILSSNASGAMMIEHASFIVKIAYSSPEGPQMRARGAPTARGASSKPFEHALLARLLHKYPLPPPNGPLAVQPPSGRMICC